MSRANLKYFYIYILIDSSATRTDVFFSTVRIVTVCPQLLNVKSGFLLESVPDGWVFFSNASLRISSACGVKLVRLFRFFVLSLPSKSAKFCWFPVLSLYKKERKHWWYCSLFQYCRPNVSRITSTFIIVENVLTLTYRRISALPPASISRAQA